MPENMQRTGRVLPVSMVRAIVTLIRPYQWVKNAFVLVPLFFGGQLWNVWCWRQAIITFFAFSFIASAVYCINDLKDIEADKSHPKKCRRPLASGAIKPYQAIIISCILIVSSLTICLLWLDSRALNVASLIVSYFVINMAYCFKLKHYAIIDVFIISLGFVIRLIAGGISCHIWLSPWIVLMTFLLALFLAFAKRRDDLTIYENDNVLVRKNIVRYNLPFLNLTLGVVGTITIVCYIMYTVSPQVISNFHTDYVYVTSIFVLIAILRYLQVAIVDGKSGSPTKVLLRDRFIQSCIALWILSFIIILYV